jgi:hypothetical protein
MAYVLYGIGTLAGIALFVAGATLIRHGFIMMTAPDEAFRSASNSAPTTAWQSLSGNIDPHARKRRDYAISAGLAAKTDGTLIPQGRLSEELVSRIS